jgi:phage terminase large subunit-like protein
MIKLIMYATGDLPISVRFDKGEDTGVKRAVTEANIRRWGRFDKETGDFLDFNIDAKKDDSWNCGNIVGAGKFDLSKIPDPGSRIWLCTFKQARDEMWWPTLKDIWPKHLLDTKRGNKGFTESDGNFKVYSVNQSVVSIITYEQGYERVEAKKAAHVFLDEEPPDRRFFLGVLEHAVAISMLFTPIRGLSWSYTDLDLKAKEDPNIKVYHATQYDSPYQDSKTVTDRMSLKKPWEIAARVFGMYSEQRGRPYFDRKILNEWARRLFPKHKYRTIQLDGEFDDVLEACRLPVSVFDETEPGVDVWSVVESPKSGVPYWMSIDTAKGGRDPEVVKDHNIAYVFRPAIASLDGEDRTDPVVVAWCRSPMKTIPFARLCLYCAIWYNCALIFPESKGESGAVLTACLLDYPFLGKMVTINQASRKPQSQVGFVTSVRTRRQAFDLVGDYIARRGPKKGDLAHDFLIKELAECVVGKGGRPDHTSTGTLDCGIAFGMGLWIWEHARDQITVNEGYRPKESEKRFDKRPMSRPSLDSTHAALGSKGGLRPRKRQVNRDRERATGRSNHDFVPAGVPERHR